MHASSAAQELSLETAFEPTVNETSGLLFLNNTLITHNDSSNSNALYDIDVATGLVTRAVIINNATNIDWEDLTHDDTYIYIGDFGNYLGSRQDLKIYRISILDYFNSASVTADIINFSYGDQTNFTPAPLATNFDAEGLIHFNTMLYIFSKNWLDGKTNIYQVPKNPGTYSVSKTDTFNVFGLVSGATYNPLSSTVMLCGYDNVGAFIIELSSFTNGLFSNGDSMKTYLNIPTNYSDQIEAITPIDSLDYFISAEENSNLAAGLYRFEGSTLAVQLYESDSVLFYPNPADQEISINFKDTQSSIFAITGQVLKTSSQNRIDISDLSSGMYWIKMQQRGAQTYIIKPLVIKH